MDQSKLGINGNTTIIEAIEILKKQADQIAQSEEAARFHQENPSWSNLFRESYEPYQDAVKEYENALEVNEWLNGKNPENGQLTIEQAFLKMSDQQRLTLFHKRINTGIASIFDEYLRAWWINRY